ncbi:tyrosine-type recombinase/integrase [Paraburkholderia sp.]|jgi:integrase|uniref:tyrosine-type recombinase/integrase n=1 Tax=Paraburkholderia sp. TaxID=1926495 RepID=UPI002F3F924D
MPRPKNKENQGLPKRWTLHHGAYYYQVPVGLEHAWDGKRKFRLGDNLPEAYRVWADRVGRLDKVRTVGQLLEQYALEVIPTKAPSTQTQNIAAMKELLSEFRGAPLTAIEPSVIYGYLRKRTAKVSGKREVEVLSHALTKAIEWGYIKTHPFAWQMRIESEPPRTRYVEDWEIVECLSIDSKRKKGSVLAVQSYIRVKLLTGMRRGDLLRLSMSDLRDDGIHLTPNKTKKSTGKRVIIGWSEELREAIAMAKAARPVQIGPFLFCNRAGECYIDETTGRAGGWESLWRGFMARVLKETKVTERFTEHDLRAKCASDAETLAHAQQLMTHADSKITERVYRRKPEMVKPLR